jgi:hypothetical protein
MDEARFGLMKLDSPLHQPHREADMSAQAGVTQWSVHTVQYATPAPVHLAIVYVVIQIIQPQINHHHKGKKYVHTYSGINADTYTVALNIKIITAITCFAVLLKHLQSIPWPIRYQPSKTVQTLCISLVFFSLLNVEFEKSKSRIKK